jgi:enamine deaminase RidA (YjgF/YER057c/UK114 family)
MSRYHLAQVNIGRLHAPVDDPLITEFREALAEINALAEYSPGFVWRFKDDSGNATNTRPYPDDPLIAYNASVWTSVEALKNYAYKSRHVEFFKKRANWFEKFPGAYTTLWWVPAGHTPSVEESKARLAHLEKYGPTPHAFTFAKPFSPPDVRLNVSSGAVWEDIVGYCRAVRIGNVVEVAGTTAVDASGATVGVGDAYAQTRFILEKIERALIDAGASLRDVVRTRMFVTDIGEWESVGRAHGEFFREIKPAASMVEVSKLINPALMVEIEATAFIQVASADAT